MSKMTKSQYLSLNDGYIHHDSPATRLASSSSLNSQVSVFESKESQPIPGEEVSASLPVVSQCRISPETLAGTQVVYTILSQKVIHNPCTIGPRIVVLEGGVLTEIRYNMWSKNFINVPTTSQVTSHDDKGNFPMMH